jgi:hypothetical protein
MLKPFHFAVNPNNLEKYVQRDFQRHDDRRKLDLEK